MTANTDEEMGHECVSKNQCLSTVLKFDQENNIFGLANDPVLNNYTIHKKISKPDRKPVFYQTPIVLHCCPVVCYQNKASHQRIKWLPPTFELLTSAKSQVRCRPLSQVAFSSTVPSAARATQRTPDT
ncbi:hypothetical protein EVAR_81535_1 [Eumeta japonica]|uniref:Uncharacterized protein n=1 Tax=Eumeta variegata TaxID=151549 RepID=A0A4C1UZU8_EUMVA|nr:hypothetical protein EVAR_81535_1 [Eumeta japonica]